ncbi:MAG: 16S rRNA (guanine(966)-N(2))-methyltransferase RsmD [Oscillospiraceae bacterium]|nr:16S rRNA (guanine(966)-N(2))-methyltransferase RsmD [Oscillospiraceae bacterium]
MRIIAGLHRGHGLIAPRGMDTRPTLDRVRESLFSILMPHLADARVLDLFAGSGALGLEALSRGARSVVFVDSARAAQEAVSHNIAALRMETQCTLLRCDWRSALTRLSQEGAQFDLVFLDPPYRMPGATALLPALAESGLLAPEALIIYEHARALPPDAQGFTIADQRDYRDTVITFFTAPQGGNADENHPVPGQF